MLCIRHQYGSIWLTNLLHASKFRLIPVHHGSMLYIDGSLHDVHQASVWIIAVHQTSIWLNTVHQASIGLINTAQLITLNLHHTLSTSFFATLFADISLEERRKKKNKIPFRLVAALLLCPCWQAMLAISLARAALEKDRKVLQSA